MSCSLTNVLNLLFVFVISVLFLMVGWLGFFRPIRLWYWLEWVHNQQTRWWLGIPSEQLEEPQASVEKGLTRHPWMITYIRIISFFMAILALVFLIISTFSIIIFCLLKIFI